MVALGSLVVLGLAGRLWKNCCSYVWLSRRVASTVEQGCVHVRGVWGELLGCAAQAVCITCSRHDRHGIRPEPWLASLVPAKGMRALGVCELPTVWAVTSRAVGWLGARVSGLPPCVSRPGLHPGLTPCPLASHCRCAEQ